MENEYVKVGFYYKDQFGQVQKSMKELTLACIEENLEGELGFLVLEFKNYLKLVGWLDEKINELIPWEG